MPFFRSEQPTGTGNDGKQPITKNQLACKEHSDETHASVGGQGQDGKPFLSIVGRDSRVSA